MRTCGFVIGCLVLSVVAVAQRPASSDGGQSGSASAARDLLLRSVQAMGTLPADCRATGTIETEAGGRTEHGAIHVLTRGSDQSSEDIDAEKTKRTIVYSRGLAKDKNAAKPSSLERSASAQTPFFPLPLFVSALQNPDTLLEYVGSENLAGIMLEHVVLKTQRRARITAA